MTVSGVIAQLRTTNLVESINFYVSKLGFELDFQFQDFYAGIKIADGQLIHLKLVDCRDPSIDFVSTGGHFHLYFTVDDVTLLLERLKAHKVKLQSEIMDTAWGTKEFYVIDDQGHTLCFAEAHNSGMN